MSQQAFRPRRRPSSGETRRCPFLFSTSAFPCRSSLVTCNRRPWRWVSSPLLTSRRGLLRGGAWWDQSAWTARGWMTAPPAVCLSLCNAGICREDGGGQWPAPGEGLPPWWVVPPAGREKPRGAFCSGPIHSRWRSPTAPVPLRLPRLLVLVASCCVGGPQKQWSLLLHTQEGVVGAVPAESGRRAAAALLTSAGRFLLGEYKLPLDTLTDAGCLDRESPDKLLP